MLIYFFIIFILYFLFVGLLSYGWQLRKASKFHEQGSILPFISVVIAVRNEEKNIRTLLNCLAEQSMPKDQFEVIFVDDLSEDKTVEIIENFMKTDRFLMRVIETKPSSVPEISPKKKALLTGIHEAKGDIIITTDGDCRFGENWLKSMVKPFANESNQFVSGPVAIEGEKNILAKIQAFEFSSLMGSGAAMINLKYPLMCNGANMAFRKSVFFHVNGYEGNSKNSSGDDVFLMQKIHLAFENSITFAKSQEAIVHTVPEPTISKLVHQRKRWASKWNKHLLPASWGLPIFLFILNFSMIVGFVMLFYDFNKYWAVLSLIMLKVFFDFLFLKKVNNFLNLRIAYWIFFITEILYPFYALFFGIAVHFGEYKWKGRIHKT